MSLRGRFSSGTAMRVFAVCATSLSLLTCGSGSAGAEDQQSAPPCGGTEIARGIVDRVSDGRTFTLNDGREVRLAAVEVPQLPLPKETAAPPGGAAAKDGLNALLKGDEVVLRQAGTPIDRYGRTVAYAFAVRDGEELFAQGELITGGYARAADRIGSPACARNLLGREQAARKARLGLWANSYYDVLNAENPADVLARRGRFALVEGKVVSVRESGPTIYVSFGRRWSEGFAVTIPKRNERNFTAAGLDVRGLAGRRIRVRGWVEAQGATQASPRIEAIYPEQIEDAGE